MKCSKCGYACACEQLEADTRICSNHAAEPVPDFLHALTGWRCFNVGPADTLRSENGTLWVPRKRFEAYCHAGGVHHSALDPIPQLTCSCGVYCYKTVEECFAHSGLKQAIESGGKFGRYKRHNENTVAFGHVSIWGRIAEHRFGYRAQYAYPKELAVTDKEVATLLSKTYGIKVNVFDVSAYVKRVLDKHRRARKGIEDD